MRVTWWRAGNNPPVIGSPPGLFIFPGRSRLWSGPFASPSHLIDLTNPQFNALMVNGTSLDVDVGAGDGQGPRREPDEPQAATGRCPTLPSRGYGESLRKIFGQGVTNFLDRRNTGCVLLAQRRLTTWSLGSGPRGLSAGPGSFAEESGPAFLCTVIRAQQPGLHAPKPTQGQ